MTLDDAIELFDRKRTRAITLIHSGYVRILDDDEAIVASQSDSRYSYHIRGHMCPCLAAEHSGDGICKHILAVHILRVLVKERHKDIDAQWSTLLIQKGYAKYA